MHDRVHLPERRTIQPDFLRVHLIEHQPPANSHFHPAAHERAEGFVVPRRVPGANARGHLHDDAVAFPIMRSRREPHVIVARVRRHGVAVGRFWNLQSISYEIAFYLNRCTFVSADALLLGGAPLMPESVADLPGPGETRDDRPRDGKVSPLVEAILQPVDV